nr:PIG-L family deacetylase [Acidimicrobiia bacterium]
VMAREPHFRVGTSDAWRPSLLLLWEADEADLLVDVSAHVDAKLDALLAHESQWGPTMEIAGADDGAGRERFRRRVLERLATWGRQAGVAHAEAFKLIDAL